MAFSGHLSDYPLSDLLFYLSSKGRSGWIVLTTDAAQVTVTLNRGRLIAAQSDAEDQRLGQRLLATGAVTPAQLDDALCLQKQETPLPALGAVLVRLEIVDESTVREALREQFVDLLCQILIHPAGMFSFRRGLPDPRGIELDVSIEREALRAIGRADQWFGYQLQVARLALSADITPDMLAESVVDDTTVLEALRAGAATLDEITRATGLPRELALRSVTQLQVQGVAHVVTPEPFPVELWQTADDDMDLELLDPCLPMVPSAPTAAPPKRRRRRARQLVG